MMEEKSEQSFHKPVLLKEVLNALKVEEIAHSKMNACFVDATVGLGGHAKEFIKRGIFTVGIDTDETTLEIARRKLEAACPGSNNQVGECFKLIHGNFKDIDTVVENNKIENIYGILVDLGVSSPQLTSSIRGLSFGEVDAELDMRLDTKTSQVRGYDLLNMLDRKQLHNLFEDVLDYKQTGILVNTILKERDIKPFKTVGEFLKVIPKPRFEKSKLHYATKAFMALRMAVNSELENLGEFLPKALSVLQSGGRLAVISFHSGEDAIVKNFVKDCQVRGLGKIIYKKPIVPSTEEIFENPRARSAKLRVIEKIA